MTARGRPSAVERSVFARLATITTVATVTAILILIVFFALTVAPHFESRELNARLRAAHFPLIGPVLALIALVMWATHVRLRRLIAPLRDLSEGVERIAGGDLQVVLPTTSGDEFASLTTAFNDMAQRVAGMLAARDQLLLDVSHELRSPLTRLKVALELLPDGEVRGRMAADVRQMETMITELLELERLRDGKAVRKSTVDLVAVIRGVLAAFDGREPPVRFEAESAPVSVEADERMIALVVRNLVENAVSYSLPDSQPVRVAVARRPPEVVVRVIDDGPGIPEAELTRIFEPFYRIDPSRSRHTGGYGLGLSMCRRIVDAHGGTIHVERRAPRGVAVVVALPMTAGEQRG